MTRNDFVELVETQCDVMFECEGRHYTICVTVEGYDIAEQTTCKNRQIFKSIEELLDYYDIGDGCLAENVRQIVIEG